MVNNKDVIDLLNKGNMVAKEISESKHSRYLSWEYSYFNFNNDELINKFDNNDEYYDYLALNLAFYLASWGMYRGSGFLLNYDYKIHVNLVKNLIEYKENNKFDYKKIIDIKEYKIISNIITDTYNLDTCSNHNLTKTLITKILLGTFGNIPAFDRYLINALKKLGCESYSVNEKSILFLNDLWSKMSIEIEKSNSDYRYIKEIFKDKGYSPMKVLDMCLWKYGKDME